MKERQTDKYPRMVKTISLGMPLGLQTFNLCFLRNIEICIKLERLYLNFIVYYTFVLVSNTCTNDDVKMPKTLHVKYSLMHFLHTWSHFQRPEHKERFTTTCSIVERAHKEVYTKYGWRLIYGSALNHIRVFSSLLSLEFVKK